MLRRAQAILANGGVMQVLDEEGFLVETVAVASIGEGPRWYVEPLPILWVLSGSLILQGVVGIASFDLHLVRFWLGVGTALFGVPGLILLIFSRRHRQLMLSED